MQTSHANVVATGTGSSSSLSSFQYRTYSAAWCCASGFARAYDTGYEFIALSAPCLRYADSTIFVHEAWHVSWAQSDTATLSPSLLSLTSSMLVPSWTPGEVIPDGKYDYAEKNDDPALGQLTRSLMYFLEVGVPLIFVALIACISACCYRRRRRQQKTPVTNTNVHMGNGGKVVKS